MLLLFVVIQRLIVFFAQRRERGWTTEGAAEPGESTPSEVAH